MAITGLEDPKPVWGGGLERTSGQNAAGVQSDVDRYRAMGAAAAQRQAYQNNYGASDQTMEQAYSQRGYADQRRDDQFAMGNDLRSMAMGIRPSQAEMLGQQANQQGMQAQQAAAASAMGSPMARAAAMRQAAGGMAPMQQAGNNQVAMIRATEMEQARARWAQQLNETRQGDLASQRQLGEMAGIEAQRAQDQAGLEMRQRQMNQQAQMWGEGKAFDVYGQQYQAAQASRGMDRSIYEGRQQELMGREKNKDQMIGAGIGAGSAMGGAVFRSDAGAKYSLSMAALGRGQR